MSKRKELFDADYNDPYAAGGGAGRSLHTLR